MTGASAAARHTRHAQRTRFTERLTSGQRRQGLRAMKAQVLANGRLLLSEDTGDLDAQCFTPTEAIRFARWVLSVYLVKT